MSIHERQNAVVLTYPGHFLLTQFTIRSIRRYMPGVSISIIADDCSELAWPDYFKDCCTTYSETVIPVSKVLSVAKVTPGWLRQQMVKMHIDLYVEYDEVFLCDGDTIIQNHIPYMVVPFQPIDLTETDSQQEKYVSESLGTTYNRFEMNGRRGIVNFPGFRETRIFWWQELRRFLEKRHNITTIEYHKQYTPLNGVSEWELLEHFKSQILNEPITLHKFSNAELNSITETYNQDFITCWESDKYYSYNWWKKQNIDLRCWNKLPARKGIWTK